jgi:glycosyltransferase involved in cell wall biosynthesis
MPQEVLLIRERFDHMGDHSGYDLLFEFIEKQYTVSGLWFNSYEPACKVEKELWLSLYPKNEISPFYSRKNFWTEVKAIKNKLLTPKIIHVLYCENNFNLLRRLKLRNKIVVTIHQPFEWWLETKISLKEYFSKVDQIIVLSKDNLAAFTAIAPGRVCYIPHGIDTEFYTVGKFDKQYNDILKCICVGQWYRDFVTLNKVVSQFKDSKNIEFRIVIPEDKIKTHPHKEALHEIINCPNVIWFNRISDNELKMLYQSSDVLLLPLIAATANNALLEGMACGLPVITNDVGGIRDYTDMSFTDYIAKEDADGFIRAIKSFLLNPEKIKKMADNARNYATINFSWELVARRTLEVYDTL